MNRPGATFRAGELAAVDPALIERLEGKVERLETALSLLESSVNVLSRPVPHADDVVTLRQLWGELPAISTALAAVTKHDELRPFVDRVSASLERVRAAVADRLRSESPDLRSGLKAVLDPWGSFPPLTGRETMLIEKKSPATRRPALIALVAGLVCALVMRTPGPAFVGMVAWLLLESVSARTQWFATLDRLRVFRPMRPPMDVNLRNHGPVTRHSNFLSIDGVKVRSPPQEFLETFLHLLRTDWFVGCRLEAPPFLVSPATRKGEDGWLLALRDGALFVPLVRVHSIQDRIAGRPLVLPLPPDRLLLMIAHLAPARRDAMIDELEKLDADWMPRAETTLSCVEGSNTAVLGSGLVHVQVVLRMDSTGRAHLAQLSELVGPITGSAR